MPQARYKNDKERESGVAFKKIVQEALLLVSLGVALFLLLIVLSYHERDPGWSSTGFGLRVENIGGRCGAWIADLLLSLWGYTAYLLPLVVGWSAYRGFVTLHLTVVQTETLPPRELSTRTLWLIKLVGLILFLIASSCLLALSWSQKQLPFGPGGLLGQILTPKLLAIFNYAGACLVVVVLGLASFIIFSGISFLQLVEWLGRFFLKCADFLGQQVAYIARGDFREDYSQKADVTENLALPTTRRKVGLVEEPESPHIAEPTIAAPPAIKMSGREVKERQTEIIVPKEGTFRLPSLSLLDQQEEQAVNRYTEKELATMSQEVESRLNDFGIEAKVVTVHPGPVVTRFELQLAAGTKVSRITALAKDLARSLSVISVRIVEIIPGKPFIGLELPNAHRAIVRLREVLATQQYESSRAPLALALGKDIAGYPVIVDLSKMPHLLVAGTTGSGKSVCLNALLLSLLYKYTPQNLRLILIDPKMLELSVYADIPHLLTPVVTDMKEAVNAFRWCVAEMERRYKLMSVLGVRNLAGYNHKVCEAGKSGTPLVNPLWNEGMADSERELHELPYIVVLADEYADMMMVVGKKVEELIARLAQKARAAGIHLILATQRPSVDVITGLIKANIPTRIAFQVSSKIDSRTILDQGGAEQLLGFGDMLYLPPGSGVPVRIHGAFVADEEVHRVVSELNSYGKPEYLAEIVDGSVGPLAGVDNDPNDALGIDGREGEQDPLYDQAVSIVLESRRASVSNIQRRLKIGYNRAARLVETMEAAGLVGPMETNGNREVLAPPLADS